MSGAPDLPGTLRGIAAAALTALSADRATLYAVDVDAQVVAGVYTTEVDPKRRAFLECAVGLGRRGCRSGGFSSPRPIPCWRSSKTRTRPPPPGRLRAFGWCSTLLRLGQRREGSTSAWTPGVAGWPTATPERPGRNPPRKKPPAPWWGAPTVAAWFPDPPAKRRRSAIVAQPAGVCRTTTSCSFAIGRSPGRDFRIWRHGSSAKRGRRLGGHDAGDADVSG